MPLVQIHLQKGKSAKYIQAVADGSHQALCKAWKIAINNRFQLISEYKKEHFHFDQTLWEVKRSDNLIAIQITALKRSQTLKQKLYREIADILSKNLKIRKEDVFVTLVEVKKEDWSFGNGLAQFLTSAAVPNQPQPTKKAAAK